MLYVQECLKENRLDAENSKQKAAVGELKGAEAARAWRHTAAGMKTARDSRHSELQAVHQNDQETGTPNQMMYLCCCYSIYPARFIPGTR